MKVIQPVNRIVSSLIETNVRYNEYIPSKFNIIEKISEQYIIFNTLSRAVILLDEKEFDVLKSPCKNNDIFLELIKMYFLIPKGIDETKRYFDIYNFNKIIKLKNEKKRTFKIYTTTHCNARCFYCFEEGIKKDNMSDKTIDAVIDYIYKNKFDGKIKLYWFGGEPLCNQKVIDKICGRLKSDEISFESTIITNGYLFDQGLIDKAINDWNLSLIQITLDGYKEEHNRRKAYVNPSVDPFDKTIRNINLLASKNIKIIVRLNFDNDNYENIKELIKFLKNEFENYNNISVMPVSLIDDCFMHKTENSNDKLLLNKRLLELQDLLFKNNMLYYGPVSSELRYNKCMADNPSSVIINTDGKFFTCQNCDDNMCYGDIYNGVTNNELLSDWKFPKQVRNKCYNCALLPECTPFDKCPVEQRFCMQNNDFRIRKKLLESYKKYINDHNMKE